MVALLCETGNSLADLLRSNWEECAGSGAHKYAPSSRFPWTDQPIDACLNATSMPAKKVGPSDAHALEDFYDCAVPVWQGPTQPL